MSKMFEKIVTLPGCDTPEPSLRDIVRAYYGPHFHPEDADRLTEMYIRAVSSERSAAPEGDAEIKISYRQFLCLEVLVAATESERVASYDSVMSETALTLHQTRCAVRALARKGLAERSPAYCDDGFLRGSGYMSTRDGTLLHRRLRNLQ